MKTWFLKKMISICNLALKNSAGAEDQTEINEVVSMKNYFLDQLIKENTKNNSES
jgi:hypothetical protein